MFAYIFFLTSIDAIQIFLVDIMFKKYILLLSCLISSLSVWASSSTPAYVYASAAAASAIEVINTSTNAVSEITLTGNPFALTMSPDSAYVYAVIPDTQIAVIDTSDNSVSYLTFANTIIGHVAVSPDCSTLYISNRNANTRSIIVYTRATASQTSISLPLNSQPSTLILNSAGTTLYALDYSTATVYVINTQTNAYVDAYDMTTGHNHGLAAGALYSDETLLYTSPQNDTTSPTNFIGLTLTLNGNYDSPTINEISFGSDGPFGATLGIGGTYLYILSTTGAASKINVIDVEANPYARDLSLTTTLTNVDQALYMTILPDNSYAYVADDHTNNVTRVDMSNLATQTQIDVGAITYSIVSTFLNPPPVFSGRALTDEFAVVSEQYNDLHWQASTSSISGYQLSRDGSVLKTFGTGVFSYQDHNRPIGQATTYTLKSYNSVGSYSAAMTITLNAGNGYGNSVSTPLQ